MVGLGSEQALGLVGFGLDRPGFALACFALACFALDRYGFGLDRSEEWQKQMKQRLR